MQSPVATCNGSSPWPSQSASGSLIPICQLLSSISTAKFGQNQSHIPLTSKRSTFVHSPNINSDRARWVEQLPELFQSHGLEAVATDHHFIDDQYRAMWGQSNLAGYLDLVDENTEGVGNADDIRNFVKALEAEMKKGASFDTTFLCVVGRKALQ